MKRDKHVSKRGQGIVEYVLITALVALAAVSIFKTFKSDISTAYKKAGEALIQGVEEGSSLGSGSND